MRHWGAFGWIVAAVVDYLVGRLRPHARLTEWVHWQLRLHLDRWSSPARQVALAALLWITAPRYAFRAWRTEGGRSS